MASQQPKFQYAPNLLDVWKQLQSVNDDLANEVDNPLPQELQQVVNLLYQRDRQLEDYLTNLHSGGGGGALPNLEVDLSTTISYTYLGFATHTWGVVDQWSLEFTGFTNLGVGSVVSGKIGTVIVELALVTDITSPTSGPVMFQALSSDYAIDLPLADLPSPVASGFLLMPLNGGFRSGSAVAAMATSTDIATRTFQIYATQPTGASSIGADLTWTGGNLELTQTQLMA